MKNILLSVVMLIFSSSSILSQDEIYFTQHATLTINGNYNDQAVKMQTNDLSIKLDYETTEIIIRFQLGTLETNFDPIIEYLHNNLKEVVFKGELGLEFINTKKHPPLNFDFQGWLELPEEKKLIKGKGELHHIGDSDQIACMLGLVLNLNFKELDIELPVKFEDDFEVIVTNAILQTDKF
ncbi:MAG: hypothetical protein DWQ02_04405 [Bacteroidetes bacterium]|nr:MAG: hypothetical protein DWQ02_04405 [Bacteroidota bacterium]